MPIYVGRARNFFKEVGIDLELVVTRGDGPDVQALMAKEVEFVATPPHHLSTHSICRTGNFSAYAASSDAAGSTW